MQHVLSRGLPWDSERLFRLICVCCVVFYIAVIMHLPVTVLPLAQHDDGWFIAKAQLILAGEWFGPYHQNTLIKGGAYAFFLSLNRLLGLPVTLTQALCFAASALIMVGAFRRLGVARIWALIMLGLLLFQPALFPVRVIRENIYTTLLLLMLGLFIYHFTEPNAVRRMLFAVFSGGCLGLFLYTREEGIWIAPTLAMLFMGAYWVQWRRESVALKLKSIGAFGLGVIMIVGPVVWMNFQMYGVLGLVDFKSKQFTQVLGTLNSLNPDEELRFVPVSAKKREVAYTVSPSFATLKPYLENPTNPWLRPSCDVYPQVCGDFAGGWFMWALRDAAALAGQFTTHANAEAFFQQIDAELQEACDSESVRCESSHVPFMPRVVSEAWRDLPDTLREAVLLTTYLHPASFSLASGRSELSGLQSRVAMLFLGNPYYVGVKPTQPAQATIAGWFYTPADTWIGLLCGSSWSPIVRKESADLVSFFSDPKASHNRFRFVVTDFEQCRIVTDQRVGAGIDLTQLSTGTHPLGSDQQLHIEYFERDDQSEWKQLSWLYMKKGMGQALAYVVPVVALAGFLALVSACVMVILGRWQLNALLWVSVALWVGYGCRVLLLTLVDITSFPTVNPGYLGPAYALLPLAALSSVFYVVNQFLMRFSADEHA